MNFFALFGIAICTVPIYQTSGLTIKVGHIGSNMVLNEKTIFEMAKAHLIESKLLDDKLQFELVSVQGCGDFNGVAYAAKMFYLENVKAFVGPSCSDEMTAVAKLATIWNVPLIGYVSSDGFLDNKLVYRTLARISMSASNGITDAVVALLRHFGLERVAIATSENAVASKIVTEFEAKFAISNIDIGAKVVFAENMTADDYIASKKLEKIRETSRIVIVLFGPSLSDCASFMRAIHLAGMDNDEYMYVLPWLYHDVTSRAPWWTPNGILLPNIKSDFNRAIVIDNEGILDAANNNFLARVLNETRLTSTNLTQTSIHSYLEMFDALRLYVLALRKAMNESGKEDIYLDGRYIWNRMRGVRFNGVSGPVIMDDQAERVPLYAVFFVDPVKLELQKIVSIEPRRMPNCDGLINNTGCYEMSLTDVGDGVWPFKGGVLPSDIPECGFLGEKCDHRVHIAVGIAVLVILLTAVAILIRYRYYQQKVLRDMPWRLSPKQIKLMRDEKMKTLMSSFKSDITNSTVGDENSTFAKNFAMVGNNYGTVRRFDQRKTIHFTKDELLVLYEMKQVAHDNLNSFLGICCNNTGLEMLVLWKYCQRGTLSDFIHNEDIQMDMRFKTSFIRDVAQGLDYLHTSTIGYHSCLTPTTTLIDNNWVVKLSDFGLEGLIDRLIKEGVTSSRALAVSPVEQFYIAPEMLRIKKLHPLRQQPSQDRLRRIQERQMADIYSFGIVLWEILFRAQPFDDAGKGAEVIVERICDYNPLKEAEPYRPTVPQCANSEYHPDLLSTMRLCWAEGADERPTMKRVRKLFETSLRTKKDNCSKGGLVDQMMAMMEQYANNLEKLVKERTLLLEETQQRADRLLRQLLPREVANELKLGKSVPPRGFDAASVLFTDIVGFTALCSSSTPMEIVGFLNQIFSGFDNIVSEQDAYKVETIGDAYLVVSGVPKENGSNHVKVIASIALKMKSFVASFELAHRPGHRLQCRWGVHTGPIAAGVVGLTAPRYCLFGDTVNMASRMESTGIADHIQISESSFFLLTGSFPGFFRCKQRGQVEVKGKGLCTTYLLEGKESDLLQLEKANSATAARVAAAAAAR